MKVVVYIAILVGIGFLFFHQQQKKTEERAAEVKYREEKAAAEQAQRDSLKQYAEGLRKLCEEKTKTAENELKEVRDDSVRLAKAVAAHMSEKGNDGIGLKYAEKVAAVLKDGDVNALAHKHMGSGFEDVASEFVARVHEVAAAESKYAAEVRKIEAAHAANSGKAAKWTSETSKQHEDEISRLSREISSLESSRAKYQKEYLKITKTNLKGSAHSERARLDHVKIVSNKIVDIDNELFRKRRQIDNLRHPDNARSAESRALSRTRDAIRDADRIRESAMWDLDRRFKPKESLVAVVAEYEKKTIGRLRGVVADKIAAAEKESKALKEKISAIDSFIVEIPISAISSLMNKKDKLAL